MKRMWYSMTVIVVGAVLWGAVLTAASEEEHCNESLKHPVDRSTNVEELSEKDDMLSFEAKATTNEPLRSSADEYSIKGVVSGNDSAIRLLWAQIKSLDMLEYLVECGDVQGISAVIEEYDIFSDHVALMSIGESRESLEQLLRTYPELSIALEVVPHDEEMR